MIDIHCHILPNLDDGSRDTENSLAMAEFAFEDGIRTIIATPHFIPEIFYTQTEVVFDRIKRLEKHLKMAEIPLNILPGMEVHLTLDVPQRLANGSVLTLNDTGKYVLLEFPMNSVPAYAGQVIFETMLKGIKPIIAHPERNKEIAEDPQILYQLIEKGCLVQVTAGSLTGHFGPKIQQLTQDFLRLGWVDFIASDAHDTVRRSFRMKEAWAKTAELVGEAGAKQLFIGNPTKLINGEAIKKGDMEPYPQYRRRVSHKKKETFFKRLSRFLQGGEGN